MKKTILKFFGRIIGYIACVWLMIWLVPMIICGLMIDILLAAYGLDSECMFVKNFGQHLKKISGCLKQSNNKTDQENE